jgi:hypothetical protein
MGKARRETRDAVRSLLAQPLDRAARPSHRCRSRALRVQSLGLALLVRPILATQMKPRVFNAGAPALKFPTCPCGGQHHDERHSQTLRRTLYALDLASRYKLQRSSMGWRAVASDGSALSDPVEILAPNTIRSLWRLGLLDGNPDPLPPVDRPSLWANARARSLLAQIARDIDWSELGPEWSPTVFH